MIILSDLCVFKTRHETGTSPRPIKSADNHSRCLYVWLLAAISKNRKIPLEDNSFLSLGAVQWDTVQLNCDGTR
jgi:hypothetical protein